MDNIKVEISIRDLTKLTEELRVLRTLRDTRQDQTPSWVGKWADKPTVVPTLGGWVKIPVEAVHDACGCGCDPTELDGDNIVRGES
jgi:hypothetical protein